MTRIIVSVDELPAELFEQKNRSKYQFDDIEEGKAEFIPGKRRNVYQGLNAWLKSNPDAKLMVTKECVREINGEQVPGVYVFHKAA
ncbi:hypothetical protein GCM10007874_58630 [Labrys miyagiensis]|uniref:Uncharacterized protein n=1 Tax=Labrys miyagiensis TaxID=346912 RepID=A0ABQ6CR99_9HYPH|nr:hypothetical protein [Labrys miyagiensis]GLS22843.1 hypothetical protein GCM10007874_58630 [Labrys miyagiensis]